MAATRGEKFTPKLSVSTLTCSHWDEAQRNLTEALALRPQLLEHPEGLLQLSVIIPTYNRSKLLRLAVESVLAQTYPAVEIIVVDDGSMDDTATIMAQYGGRVTYIRQPNKGVKAARNAGRRAG